MRSRFHLDSMLLAVATVLAHASCSRDPNPLPPNETRQRPSSNPLAHEPDLASVLGIDAAEVGQPQLDPPAPPGNLKAEVETFTSLNACVELKARIDPVLGEAVDALGYDTLLRDSCRVLQAIKTNSTAPCDSILSSSLRDRCTTSTAIATGNALACPMIGQNHDPFCLALAHRDTHLCVHASPERRKVCRALLDGDMRTCRQDKRCERWVLRWQGMIPPSQTKPDLGSRIRLDATETNDGGTLTPISIDFSQVLLPAVVSKSATGARILLGDATSAAWPSPKATATPRLLLTMDVSPSCTKQGKHSLRPDQLTYEMILPRVAKLSGPAQNDVVSVTVDTIGLEVGTPVRFTLETDAEESPHTFHVRLDVNTYVRDLVIQNKM